MCSLYIYISKYGKIDGLGVKLGNHSTSCPVQFEDGGREKGYGEVLVGAEDIVVATSPKGRAHALANLDHIHSTYFLGCQDALLNASNPETDFHIWKDL